jgi:excisionase family DNA binding protein
MKEPSSPLDPILVSRDQAAELLAISRRSLDYLIADKKLPSRRIGRRVLIAYADLKKFARADHPFRISPEDREVA